MRPHCADQGYVAVSTHTRLQIDADPVISGCVGRKFTTPSFELLPVLVRNRLKGLYYAIQVCKVLIMHTCEVINLFHRVQFHGKDKQYDQF